MSPSIKRALGALALLSAVGCGAAQPEPTTPVADTPAPIEAVAQATPERAPLTEPRMIALPSESPLVTLRVSFQTGSADDPAGKEGLAHLTAAVMADGGAGELDYSQRVERLYPMAAQIEAHVGRDQTVFVGQVHADHLDDFYALFRATLLEPRFAQADFDRVLAQTQSALMLELRGNDDEALGRESLQAAIYAHHPYGHPVIGTETGLGSIALADLDAFRHRALCAGRATVGLTGRVPDGFAQRVLEDVNRLSFEQCEGRLPLPEVAEVEPNVLLVHKAEARAVAVSMGMPIDLTRADADYPALLLAAAYLGQHRQFAGVLMQKIRGQRGINYGDYAYTEHFEQDGWTRFPRTNISRRQQYFSIWLRPLPRAKAHFAIRLAVRELRAFAEHGLGAEDFERIRHFVTRYVALYQQTGSRRLGSALDDAFYGQDEAWIEHLRAAWASMTREQVNAAIRRHVHPEHLTIAAVVSDAEAFATALADETPSPIEYQATPNEEVLAEDREIVGYRIGIPRERIRVVPVAQMFH